jgi:uncharacterized membrane protein
MSRLLGYFVRGCLVLVPVGLTLYAVWWLIHTLDQLLGVSIPGLGIAAALLLITAIGVLFSNVVGRKISELIDRLFERLPLVKVLYTSIRDLLNAFLGEERRFGQAVTFRLSANSETRLFGFLTRRELDMFQLHDHVAVYVPQAYNIGGQVLGVPRALIEPLDVKPADMLTFLVSGGASGFRDRASRPS